uniref:FYVE, RhoGEF and PH domain containing 6 n=1 Tax=Scleropages formosus TaxID=113540 RepID=A0A8C9SJ51_SCLFO
MSTGVKKPPVAPKPKLIQPLKPTPPPVAPKPDILLSHPSPVAVKKAKPAVAPKPCFPKTTTTPESKCVGLKGVALNFTQERTESSEDLGLLNSRNGMLSEFSKPDSDYIIRTCSCNQDNCLQCERTGNCKITETDQSVKQWETCQNGRTEKNKVQVSPVPRFRNKPELSHDKTGGGSKSQVVNAVFMEQKIKDVWAQAVSTSTSHLKQRPPGKSTVQAKAAILDQNLNAFTETIDGSTGKQTLTERSQSDETNGNDHSHVEQLQETLGHVEISVSATESNVESGKLQQKSSVPAAPQKPLPIPMPRKPRKPALVRQEGIDSGVQEIKERTETVQEETKDIKVHCDSPHLSSKVLVHMQSVSYSRRSDDNCEHSPKTQRSEIIEDSNLPLPPPRQASLTPELGKMSNLVPDEQLWEGEESRWGECFMDEDAREQCSEFARYPVTRSLPKKLKLNCNLQLSVAASVEERSPKVAPKKPQRHSLPASGLLKKEFSEEVEESSTSQCGVTSQATIEVGAPSEGCSRMTEEDTPLTEKELPAPPAEKLSWRFTRSIVPFFGKQTSRNNSTGEVQSKVPAPNLGKQRAKSFSSADLDRSDGQKRSSFRRILELKMSMRMLPKLLAKGSQSLDCTSVETEPSMDENCVNVDHNGAFQGQQGPNSQHATPFGTPARERKLSCPQVGMEQNVDGEEFFPGVEYENLPLYEEIPEYMNLPFLNATGALSTQSTPFGWQNSSSMEGGEEEGDIYEEQEPYMPQGSCTSRGHQRAPYKRASTEEYDRNSEEEDVLDSSDEEDSSSASSKGEAELSGDRQNEAGAKKTKVVYIAKEIMSSEKVFVDVLKLLHIDFRDAVAKASRQSGKPVVEERVLNQILYYLPQLYELNRDLLRELEERVARWSDHQRLADIFVKKGPYLKMYSTYIREFDRNVALLDEQCRKNPVFATVVRDFEMSPRCANLALKHYLLKPVQRIPQYQLLLTDYLKNLTEDSSDYKDTQAALGIVKEVANHANDIMKQGDNFQKLMQIQYSLNGHHEIVQPGRVFLKEGTLMKLSRKVMQPRMFFLFNDTILYTTPVQSGQYKLNNMLSLAGMKVSKPSQEAYQNELNIESVERSFILSASSATERDEWLEAISKAIEDHTRKKITFISSKSLDEPDGASVDAGAPLGSKAPIWIPDLRATMCMICTCEFTLTWRRHHCRACGKVVCQACSSNKHYLEYLKNRLARVCDHCFAKLQEKGDSATPATPSPSGKSSTGAFTSVLNSIPSRKQKKIPAALKEVSANTENSSMSGYLLRSKGNKKPWKRLWFVIKNKVLYTYAASEDVAALESQPLLGFFLREERSGAAQKLQFKLYHKNTLYYIFKADDVQTAQKWIEAFQDAMIL